jgi:hypothetical protein
MTQTLLSIFPNPSDLLALEPEELGGVTLEVAPTITQNGLFTIHGFLAQLFLVVGPSYPHNVHRATNSPLQKLCPGSKAKG